MKMSTNEIFVQDFGRRVLQFIQGKTKNTAEIRFIQDSFVRNVTRILDTPIIHSIFQDAKLNVAKGTAEQLRAEIVERQKRLLEIEEIENQLTAKRTSTSQVTQQTTQNSQILLDDSEDEILIQATDSQQIISPPHTNNAPHTICPQANKSSQDDLSQEML